MEEARDEVRGSPDAQPAASSGGSAPSAVGVVHTSPRVAGAVADKERPAGDEDVRSVVQRATDEAIAELVEFGKRMGLDMSTDHSSDEDAVPMEVDTVREAAQQHFGPSEATATGVLAKARKNYRAN